MNGPIRVDHKQRSLAHPVAVAIYAILACSLGVFGLLEGTDAQARAEAWQTAAGAAADSGEAK